MDDWRLALRVGLTLFALGPLIYYLIRTSRQRTRKGPALLCEYWVYLPTEALPPQEALMHHMLAGNPHRNAIGKREGLLFTDVRLHIGLALRSKNPELFRPDLFGDHVEVSAEALARLSNSVALAKIVYGWHGAPLPDKRHLQFLHHMVGAMMRITGGNVFFDVGQEQLSLSEDMEELLGEMHQEESWSCHVRVAKQRVSDQEIRFVSKGLRKIGLPEFQTETVPADEWSNVSATLWDYLEDVWEDSSYPYPKEYERMGSIYSVTIDKPDADPMILKLYRRSVN